MISCSSNTLSPANISGGGRSECAFRKSSLEAFPGHCQVADRCAFLSLALSARARLAGTRHLTPETERAGSQETVVSRSEQVAADPE